jgi:hypothetical protein
VSAPGGTSYFGLLARIVESCAHDVETHAYYDDVTDREQHELEHLVDTLRAARDIATALDAHISDPNHLADRILRRRRALGNRVELAIELAAAAEKD